MPPKAGPMYGLLYDNGVLYLRLNGELIPFEAEDIERPSEALAKDILLKKA